jgi:two-component system response regulator TtrR
MASGESLRSRSTPDCRTRYHMAIERETEKVGKNHVFFLDDESQVRDVVKETLEDAGIGVTCFACANECLAMLSSVRCDLLITDLRMPEKNGLELLGDVKRLAPWIPVLMITGYGDVPTAVKAMKGGAVDFIEKPLGKRAFLQKIKAILQESTLARVSPCEPLTRTERQVLRLIIDGKSNRDIANLIHRSVRTVEVHRAHIMRKCGVDDLVNLIKRCAAMEGMMLESKQRPQQTASDGADSP